MILFGAVFYYLFSWGDEIFKALKEARIEIVGVAWLLSLGTGFLYSYTSFFIYRGLGVRLSFPRALRIVCISQLGKYLPGKVMFAGNYYILSRGEGVGNPEIGASLFLSLALMILTGSLFGLPALSLLSPALRRVALLLPLALLLLIHPRSLQAIMAGLAKIAPSLLGEERHTRKPLTYWTYLGAFLIYLIVWILTGLQLYLVASAFSSVTLADFPLFVAASALGLVFGFLILFAPVGLGVREGVGTFLLGQIMSPATAALTMITFRVVTTLVDVTLGLVSLAYSRRVTGRGIEFSGHF